MVVVYGADVESGVSWVYEAVFLEYFSVVIFYCYNRWFFTILAADHFGIFSYWRIDIMSGAGDNTNEDSDV